jgi:hypothetical protein
MSYSIAAAVIVFEQATQTLPTMSLACEFAVRRFGLDELMAEALVVALAVELFRV